MEWILGSLISLIVFTIVASFLYHPPTDKTQLMPFLKNMSIVAGLFATIVSIHDFIYHSNFFAQVFGGAPYGDCRVQSLGRPKPEYYGNCKVFNK